MPNCNFVLTLGVPGAELPDLDKCFYGANAWSDLDDYLGQEEGYSAEKYRSQDDTVVSKKDGTTYELWIGVS